MNPWMVVRRTAAAVLVLLTVGCGALDVSDPTAIEDSELNDGAGAEMLRQAALRYLYIAIAWGGQIGGFLTDEFLFDPPQFGSISQEEILDRRQIVDAEQLPHAGSAYVMWQEARRAAAVAMPKMGAHGPAAHLGELYAVRGFAALRLAEDFCPGFPLHEIVDFKPVYGPPLTTAQAMERALADFDTALVHAADSARVLNLARVGRARALLGLGRFADAAAVAGMVPVEYVATAEYSAADQFLRNTLFSRDQRASVANEEGGTGLDFVAADDPRVRLDTLGTANDGLTGIYAPAKYPDEGAPIVIASGVEARLIEAEAALNADPESGAWLTILNTLRTDGTPDGAGGYNSGTGGVAGLAPLVDPGTPTAREDLLFREWAFWLFATGHRLGDLRRLIAHYGRSSESVFPTGPYRVGGTYETATSLPFPATQETPFNPAITGCTSR